MSPTKEGGVGGGHRAKLPGATTQDDNTSPNQAVNQSKSSPHPPPSGAILAHTHQTLLRTIYQGTHTHTHQTKSSPHTPPSPTSSRTLPSHPNPISTPSRGQHPHISNKSLEHQHLDQQKWKQLRRSTHINHEERKNINERIFPSLSGT